MSVRVSPNPRKTTIFVDVNGNEVKPFTKEIVKKKDQGYAPTAEELAGLAARPPQEAIKPGESALGGLIATKVEEQIGKAIVDAIGKLDIGKMVSDALEKAIK